MDKFRVLVYMLMRDASPKQRIIPCIMRISILGSFSAGKKCALHMGKYGIAISQGSLKNSGLNRSEPVTSLYGCGALTN